MTLRSSICKIKYILWLLPLIIFAGCIKTSFQPIPPYYKLWIKPENSPLDSRIALLECGWPSPWPTGHGSDVATMSANDKTLADRCMEISGFSYKDPFNGYRRKLICSDPWVAKYPACQHDAIIPTRSVERRLNSYYCTGYGKNTPECLPPGHEYVPQQQSE
jgi:hypothetical protein